MLPTRNRSYMGNKLRQSQVIAADDPPPPLPPKRSISLPGNGVPKGILRKNDDTSCHMHPKRYSMTELRNTEPKLTKRCSLQEPLEIVWEKCLNMTPQMQSNLSQALEFVEELSEMPEYLQPHFDNRMQMEAKSSHVCCNTSLNDPCVCQRRVRLIFLAHRLSLFIFASKFISLLLERRLGRERKHPGQRFHEQ